MSIDTKRQVHRLKVRPEYFAEIKAGRKHFEIRKDDRSFASGDIVVLCELTKPFPGKDTRPTGREFTFRIGYILRPEPLLGADGLTRHSSVPGLDPGYCIFGLEPLEERPPIDGDRLSKGAS